MQNFKTIEHIKDVSTLCNVLVTEASEFDIQCSSKVIAISWLIVYRKTFKKENKVDNKLLLLGVLV